ncbi:glucosaminidase domain-containing protein [Cobetia sp. QF-1]|uniref:glucosaminidase domain-containing protein n=1 Tax=Cobetia sp. QF-1 TaxID=1969833 RepID=UPI000B54723B|nr:glucosaminidase domain-containing protein [Cobetia sp. QF-1]
MMHLHFLPHPPVQWAAGQRLMLSLWGRALLRASVRGWQGLLTMLGIVLMIALSMGSAAQAARLDDELVAKDSTQQMPDLRVFPAGTKRKVAFFELMIPLIVAENQRLAEQRDWLLAMRKRAGDGGRDYSEREQERLNGLCDQANLPCDVTREDIGVSWNRLLLRIDTLPLDMVLVQAIEESGWGTSGHARNANNLFGMRCFSHGCGIGAAGREYRRFENLETGMAAYFSNLNSQRSYAKLRELRGRLRNAGQPVRSEDLIPTLSAYSTRGNAYFVTLYDLLRWNRGLMRTVRERLAANGALS